jgi:hypothetical protein
MSNYVFDDGGRAAAGFKGSAGDCVTRAISIATGTPYSCVYAELFGRARRAHKHKGSASPRNGVAKDVTKKYLADLGWTWVPTMRIGEGCTVHLKADELPAGRIIAQVSKHLVAVIDGVIHDTFDPSRGGTRCVYGYWRKI